VNAEVNPVVGHWYRSVEKGQTFTVIGVDEEEGIIEIQHVNGEIEEIDTNVWSEMELELVDEPDEWRGALNNVDDDDLEYEDDDEDDDWNESEDDEDRGDDKRN